MVNYNQYSQAFLDIKETYEGHNTVMDDDSKLNDCKDSNDNDYDNGKYSISSNSDCNELNRRKRAAYSMVELLRMNLESDEAKNINQSEEGQELLEEMKKFASDLNLGYVERKNNWWNIVDEITRCIAIWLTLVTYGITLALPWICLLPLESMLISMHVINSRNALSTIFRKLVANTAIAVSGITLIVEGLDDDLFAEDRSTVLCFAHTSTMDAFIVAAAVPVRMNAIAKHEMFLYPFFSWLLIASGAIPLVRSDREKAVQGLKTAASLVREGDCICMSPEGTRSKSGHLQEFKKGAFHVASQLNAKMIPLVIFGAYDLYPPHKIMTMTGKVYARVLPAVDENIELTGDEKVDDETRRTAMSARLRRDMLASMELTPADAGMMLSWFERIRSNLAIIVLLVVDFCIFKCMCAFKSYFNLSNMEILLWGSSSVIAITLALYVIVVHVVPFFMTSDSVGIRRDSVRMSTSSAVGDKKVKTQ